MTDPFATLGLEPSMDLDRKELESRYLALSRDAHPDHNAGPDLEQAVRRSAEINDAYRVLRDPWRRAEILIDRLEPDCLDRTKTLPPAFLMEAMELAEEVEDIASAEDTSRRDAMRSRLESEIESYLARIRSALAEGDAERAARAHHEARYFRKALADLAA